MKNILFISYYWPPSGKASLHWPLKIIKHLPQFGWMPSVLTVEEDTFSQKDDTFVNEVPKEAKVYRARAYEPFNLYKKLTGKKKEEQLIASETISQDKKSFSHHLSIWIRMNLFIPDSRVGWYFPAIKKGTELLRENKVDVIISVGPPHTTHLVAKKLALKLNIPFVPVFIDPWTDIAYYKNFKRNIFARKIDLHLEKSVLENSSAVIFVTKTMKEDYDKKYLSIKDKTHVLYWGYSEEDFSEIELKSKTDDEKVIVHAGNIFSYQNPVNFWRQIKKEIDSGKNLKLKFIGTVDSFIKKTINEIGLTPFTEYAGFMPYKKMLEEICIADYLLVCATEPRHVPGKFFEYLQAGKPIIAFGNVNDEVKNILQKANAGMMFGYKESGEEILKGNFQFNPNKNFIESFERRKIAEKFGDLLTKISPSRERLN
jgi:glycosyltransferase involved in cell wall biosynthesis